jgi:putative MATE family efflux protein
VLIFTAIANIFLDYWFVLGGLGIDPMGIKGIALATVIAEAITFLYLFYRVRKTPLLQSYSAFYVDRGVFTALLKQGLPPSTNMVLMATGIYIITYFAAPFGKEVLAAFGIGMRIEQIILMPAIGLNVAVLAIVSQNNGAKEFERIAQALKLALYYGLLVSLLGMLLLLGGAEELMGVFSSDAKVIKEGALYLRIEAFILFSFVVIFVNLAMLQGIEKPVFIFYISLFRQIVAPILLLSIFAYFGLGVVWIWLGIAAIVTLSAVMTWQYSKKRLLEASLSQK